MDEHTAQFIHINDQNGEMLYDWFKKLNKEHILGMHEYLKEIAEGRDLEPGTHENVALLAANAYQQLICRAAQDPDYQLPVGP